MLRDLITGALLAAALPASAQTVHSYGDTVIDELKEAHREIAAVEIRATAKDGSAIVLARGESAATAGQTVPLANSMGEQIGTISVRFRQSRHVPTQGLAQEVSRRVYLAGNLIEPDPFVPGARRSRLGQAIVDRLMARNPDLVTLGLHVGSSGASNAILASNFGRIGKPGDKDDARVIDHGETLKEPTNGGKRLAVSLPMLDRRGRVVGALSTSFLVGPGGNDAAAARAVAVRDEMARQIGSLEQLLR